MGVQIDLLIDRADGVINLCEIKHCQGEFTLTKSIAENIEKKIHIYKTLMQVPKTVLLTMIAPYGVRENKHSLSIVSEEILLDDLFQKEFVTKKLSK